MLYTDNAENQETESVAHRSQIPDVFIYKQCPYKTESTNGPLIKAKIKELHGNGIPSGISYQKLTRGDDDGDGYIIHALNTVYVPELQKWIRLDARGNKATVHAE